MSSPDQIADVVILGAGPAGLFAAMTLAEDLDVLVVDRRSHAGGAGGYTDGKLNLSPHIGLDLGELRLTEAQAAALIDQVDAAFLDHGADPTVYGEDEAAVRAWLERVSWVRQRTPKGDWDITLVPVKQRHMGTDFAHRVTGAMADTIRTRGGRVDLGTEVTAIHRTDEGGFRLTTAAGAIQARCLLACPGREGAHWMREQARSLGGANTGWGAIDIGCQVEVAAAVYDEITVPLYDPKLVFVTPHLPGPHPHLLHQPRRSGALRGS